jgi:biotin-(acetyl-CoA carboxylase) ligase
LRELCAGENIAGRAYLCEYRELSFILNGHISYRRGEACGRGIAAGIDDDGRLLVKPDGGGETIALDSGEVSIVAHNYNA